MYSYQHLYWLNTDSSLQMMEHEMRLAEHKILQDEAMFLNTTPFVSPWDSLTFEKLEVLH